MDCEDLVGEDVKGVELWFWMGCAWRWRLHMGNDGIGIETAHRRMG